MSEQMTAAIIAGGKSRRFGAPKTEAFLARKTLLEHAVDIARRISETVDIIGRMDYKPRGAHAVHPDLVSGCGPVCGIFTALYYCEKPWLAVLPVDMPLLNPAVYRFLYPLAKNNRPVVARSHKGMEPLVSIWPKNTLAAFEQAIESGAYRLHKLIESENGIVVSLPERMPEYRAEWFININYKKDLERALDAFQPEKAGL